MLYARMEANLVASWERFAEGSAGAAVTRVPGAAVAAFPTAPERGVFNNTLLGRGLDTARVNEALAAAEDVYAGVGVDAYAVWSHESERATRAALEVRGYHVDSSTRAMAMALDDLIAPRPTDGFGPAKWAEYLQVLDLPPGLLAGVDPAPFHVRVATLDGARVAGALGYDHGGDCGIYNVVTVPHARRRGIATALTALLLHEARDRGCTTASLQATEMAERVYTAVGFRDLGRFIEYVK